MSLRIAVTTTNWGHLPKVLKHSIKKDYRIKSQFKIEELYKVQFVHVSISSCFKCSFLTALLNECNDGELLLSDHILHLQSEGLRYLSECLPKVTIV